MLFNQPKLRSFKGLSIYASESFTIERNTNLPTLKPVAKRVINPIIIQWLKVDETAPI